MLSHIRAFFRIKRQTKQSVRWLSPFLQLAFQLEGPTVARVLIHHGTNHPLSRFVVGYLWGLAWEGLKRTVGETRKLDRDEVEDLLRGLVQVVVLDLSLPTKHAYVLYSHMKMRSLLNDETVTEGGAAAERELKNFMEGKPFAMPIAITSRALKYSDDAPQA